MIIFDKKLSIQRGVVPIFIMRQMQQKKEWERGMDLAMLERRLRIAKERLAMEYERKGETDWKVLKAGDEVDRLINVYQRMKKESSSGI